MKLCKLSEGALGDSMELAVGQEKEDRSVLSAVLHAYNQEDLIKPDFSARMAI